MLCSILSTAIDKKRAALGNQDVFLWDSGRAEKKAKAGARACIDGGWLDGGLRNADPCLFSRAACEGGGLVWRIGSGVGVSLRVMLRWPRSQLVLNGG